MRDWSLIGDDPAEAERIRLTADFAECTWRSRMDGGEFDFGEEADFRCAIDLFVEMVRKRYSRARPCTPMMARQQMGLRAMLYRLKAKIDVASIAEDEVRATGWDRSDYAPR
jgi:hypothetical protein